MSYNLVISLEMSLVLVIDLKSDVNVVFRPYITEFLETASVYYNITVVSAISRSITEKIVAHVDPNGKCIKKKLLLRQTGDVKKVGLDDLVLSSLDRAHTLIVRNTNDVCLKNNGCEIEIPAWDNDQGDKSLMELSEQLKDIAVSRVENLEVYVKKLVQRTSEKHTRESSACVFKKNE